MPFVSQAQAGWAFANKKPFARRWARQTGPYTRLPYKKRKKAFTIQQLEAFVSSPAYDAATAGLIALGIPALPSLKGEQIAPGVTRIHGNLCNVHGKYGPCDKSLSGKKPKGGKRAARKPTKAKLTPQQRAAQRDQEHQQNRGKTLTQQGYSPADQAALEALRSGTQPSGAVSSALIDQGVVEQASDGSYRLTSSGRALMNAASQADAGRARDTVSSARDRVAARNTRRNAAAVRQQEAATRHAQAAANREQARQARLAKQQAKKPAKAAAAGGGGNKKQPEKPAVEKPRRAPAKRAARSSAPSGGRHTASEHKKPAAPKPEKAPAKQLAPALTEAAQSLSDGKQLSEDDTQALIRNGLARLNKDGDLILTAAGMRATLKEYSFRVFKDASGRYRWVAQSSTAFQDRDKEIVSTKALADDCAFADETGSYGPLRWWHTPGLDLGDCDFNAMHGRVLIESGTFRTPQIAQKVAAAADGLEISLGFLHLPTEPDASGVFHHIRRFERSLVPRGKASNRFTAFTVKEIRMASFSPEKIKVLKDVGLTDDEIAGLSGNANATEKAATDQGVAYKAENPEHFINASGTEAIQPGQRFKAANGDEYVKSPSEQDPTGMYYATKAMPPMIEDKADAENPMEDTAEGGMEEPGEDTGGLTLSPEDLQAISDACTQACQAMTAQIMGALDLEKKVAGHVQGLMAPYTAQKDASDAEKAEQIAALQASLKAAEEQQAALKGQLDELLGLQPAVKAERASEAPTTIINPWVPTDQQLLAAVKDQVAPGDQFAFGDLVQNLFGNQTPGQA